ncbi:MAG TPA: O-antigen polysaccharide polymerase Wzy [Blastocatellia bacterium]|nr:O-antigen polysaccharide polymerase Wzy [Blastocatellia bacterium]
MSDIGSYLDLPQMILVDLGAVTVCIVLLMRFARLSHSHPGTIYLFFHIYTFTFRLLGVAFGADTLFSSYAWLFEPVRLEELIRAAVYGDIALLAMTVAWIRANIGDKRRLLKSPKLAKESPSDLSLRHIWTIVVCVFPVGLFGLYAFSFVPGLEGDRMELGEWQTSSWLSITQVWTGLSLLALIFWYGFRWWLSVLMSIYLILMAYQGFHRFRVIIPAILLIQIYLDRRKMRWPPVYVMGALVVLGLLFFPLKNIGQMAREGEAVTQIVDNSREAINRALVAEAPDQTFLDLFACALTLMDENDKLYYGSTYLNLLTLPIPRQWWPDKPSLADYIRDISRPWRPMSEMGMIVTYLGESYVNFGFLGILFVPYLVAYWLARSHFRAYRSSYYSAARFAYLLLACNLIQVYRDGLVSIVVFTFVNMMPLTLIVLLHLVLPSRKTKKIAAVAATH